MKSMGVMAFRDAYLLFADAWSLYKEFAGRALTDREIDVFVDQVEELRVRHRSDLATELLVAIVSEIERIRKIKEEAGCSQE